MDFMFSFDPTILAAIESTEAEIPPGQFWAAGAATMLVLMAMTAFSYLTRAGVIARATTKESIRQPVFSFLLGIGLIVLVFNTFVPFFSLGDDIKMQKDCGLATILISGLLLAVWTSSIGISNEIEGKTAMTLLSKPINRRQFVVGKYVGILQGVLWLLLPLLIAFLLLIFYKVGYDAKESGAGEIPEYFDAYTWLPNPERMRAVLLVLPGIALIFLEIAVLTAVSVALSTRVPMVVNIVSCLAIFVVGHLAGVLVQTNQEGLEPVQFVAKLIATILPSLDVFNMQAAVATDTMVPPVYLGYAALYCVVYCTAAILLAFILFEDRDLA